MKTWETIVGNRVGVFLEERCTSLSSKTPTPDFGVNKVSYKDMQRILGSPRLVSFANPSEGDPITKRPCRWRMLAPGGQQMKSFKELMNSNPKATGGDQKENGRVSEDDSTQQVSSGA